MDFSFLTGTFIGTVAHLMGVALGAGGAFMSDAMFFSSIRDRRIIKTEMRFLSLGASMVWSGLTLLLASGLLLFFLDMDRLIESGKFLAKMTIVIIITLNGLIFHFTHIKWMKKVQGKKLSQLKNYPVRRNWLLVNGGTSMGSWIAALTLGTLSTLNWNYMAIMSAYTLAIVSAIVGALILRNQLLPIKA